MADNGFNSTVQALFKGLEGFLTTKTVVGDAVKFDDGTIILPLVDVTFGAGAGAFSGGGCYPSARPPDPREQISFVHLLYAGRPADHDDAYHR
mgnify:CR=1 FL=1